MQRRNFIKSTICLGCLGFFASGCKNVFIGNDKLESDKFYYKSQEELPKKIRLEACSLCQLNCPECQTRLHEKQAPKDWLGYLKYEDFKKFVDNNKFREIELANKGEIFLNPELDEIIKYANLKGIRLTADTGVNFNDVSETTLENLVKYKFKRISISIDGATPETYSIYRRGGDFNKVINNIKKVNQFKEKYASEFPRLTWNFIVFGHNEHEIESAKKKAKELGMKNTRFKNASGLHHKDQVTTAQDMVVLSKALIEHFPEYYKLFSVRGFRYGRRYYGNHNLVARFYKGGDGLKTGYVDASGYHVVGSAKRNGKRLIGVILGRNSVRERDRHMFRLLDFGFRELQKTQKSKETEPFRFRRAMIFAEKPAFFCS